MELSPPLQRVLPQFTISRDRARELLPVAVTVAAFLGLFFEQLTSLVSDWWQLPEAGHGLLLAPVAIWLAWRSGRRPDATAQPKLGAVILALVVLARYAGGLAAELFIMRSSMIAALVGITVYFAGLKQVRHWWLPFTLLFLSVPLPELITQALALPLQFRASRMGAALLEMRHVPVLLSGNVIRLPGEELFVTEACSGLRSLTALVSTAVLTAALFLKTPVTRTLLVLAAIPIAIVVNGVRVFLTGFLVYFVSPAMGDGFMHATEGWLLFLASLSGLAALAFVGKHVEHWVLARRSRA